MAGSVDPEVDAILEAMEAAQTDEVQDPHEGLRERKKRRQRQKISDVATAMFLVHGFDQVTVAQVAAACEVSEQTVFNYFPTKESMLFDRAEATSNAVADAVRERGDVSLVEAVVRALPGGMQVGQRGTFDEAGQLQLFRRFCAVATESQALTTARLAEFATFAEEVSAALAKRVGAASSDPEVQLATYVIGGLLRVRLQSTFDHVQRAASIAALDEAVARDLQRAAKLAEPTLTAFDNLHGAAEK